LQYLVRRDFPDILPFLGAIRAHADSDREALGFLPESAYAEAARQRKLVLLISQDGETKSYVGHLLFGGIFPNLRVRQIVVDRKYRGHGHATTLLRALIAQGEKEGYLSVVANVATDLVGANSFYERNGFISRRSKAGGATRNRIINVRTLQLETPSLLSLMSAPAGREAIEIPQPKKRTSDIPIYAIDLNVFFDAIRDRSRSDDAGAVFEAALRHQIRIAVTEEFVVELERTSRGPKTDPVLSLARRIPNLPPQDRSTIERIVPIVAQAVFPERLANSGLRTTDQSDVLHLAHAVAAGASGYVTSDSKILSARDQLMTKFNLDVIGLSEFVDLLDLPTRDDVLQHAKTSKNFRIQVPAAEETMAFLESERSDVAPFLVGTSVPNCERLSISDNDGIVGVGLLSPASGLDQPSRAVVCVRQEHPFSSTVADFLVSEHVRSCSRTSVGRLVMLDLPSHPITRRVALGQGFQHQSDTPSVLAKIALGQPITENSWNKVRLSVERLGGFDLLSVEAPSFG
jgi:ribosomal protein S18 acetylase RimI-like enzyme/predicted nucleic acid-binding protein